MTLREKVQSMVEQIDKLYDDANWLRDLATGEEKKYWNEFRGNFFDVAQPLRKLDDSMSDSRAQTKI
jgi:very-short-patch-repair endonuclease